MSRNNSYFSEDSVPAETSQDLNLKRLPGFELLTAEAEPMPCEGSQAKKSAGDIDRRKNKAMIEDVFVLYEKNLLQWLIKIVGDADSAKDIAQSSFFNVWRYAQRAVVKNPKALIFKTARNLALNELRRRDRHNKHCVLRDDLIEIGPFYETPSDEASPEERIYAKEDLQALLDALEKLPPSLQHAFKLHKLKGLTYQQIADVMSVSESSIERYVTKAHKHLKETYCNLHKE